MRQFINACLLLLVSSTVVYADTPVSDECTIHHCIGVIDAGSTGTRFHVYSFDKNSLNTPVKIREIWFNMVDKGLSTIDADKEKINPFLDELLTNSKEKNYPIYF